MPHLEPFIRKNDDGIPCYTHKDISYFQGQKKSVVENGTCYDLIDILEHYKGSYGVHRNTSLAGMSNSPLIGSHRGEDYYRKNDQLWESFPTLGLPGFHKGGYKIDSLNKRILYNPDALIEWADTYFLQKNNLQTQASVWQILHHILSRWYKIFQTTYLKPPHIKVKDMDDFYDLEWLKNEFVKHTWFASEEIYVVEWELKLQDVQQGHILPQQRLIRHANTKSLIQILSREHRGKQR